jgi:hypothetical protein
MEIFFYILYYQIVPNNQWQTVVSETRKVMEHEQITESKEQKNNKI